MIFLFRITRIMLILTLFSAAFMAPASSCHGSGIKQVVIIRYPISLLHFETVVDNFKKRMSEHGYQKGRDIEFIDILIRSADRDSAPEVRQAVRKYMETADMFITCGWVSLYARDILKDSEVPQLFVPVLRSVALKMLPTVTRRPETNLSGLYLMYPPEKILRIARFILPGLKRYGYIYDSGIPADVVFKKAYEDLPEDRRHGIHIISLDLAEGVDRVIKNIRQLKIQAFGGIVGSFKHRRALAASDIPMISAFTLDVDENTIKKHLADRMTLAGLYNPFGYCGRQAADMTAAIFDGRKTIRETIPRPSKQIAFINLEAAEHLGIPVHFRALETVDLVVQ